MRGSSDFCQSYLALSLFYSLQRGSNGFIAEKTILLLYQGSRGGPLFSKGGGRRQTFSRGVGVQMLISLETHVRFCYFPGGGEASNFFQGGGGPNANFFRNPCTFLLFSRGGGVRTPYPPLDPHMGNAIITGQYLSLSRF